MTESNNQDHKFEALKQAFPDLNMIVDTLIAEIKADQTQSQLKPIDLLNVTLSLVKLMTILDAKGVLENFDRLGWLDPEDHVIPEGTQGWIYMKSGVAVRGFWDSTNPDYVFFQYFTKLTQAQKAKVKGLNHG